MCYGELNLDHVDQMIPFLDRERFAFKSITGYPPQQYVTICHFVHLGRERQCAVKFLV